MTPEILERPSTKGLRARGSGHRTGQVARRGGILDVFPSDRAEPVRVEFFGDTVESLRRFDPDTQRATVPSTLSSPCPSHDVFATRSVLAALPAVLAERFALSPRARPLLEALERGLPPRASPSSSPSSPGRPCLPGPPPAGTGRRDRAGGRAAGGGGLLVAGGRGPRGAARTARSRPVGGTRLPGGARDPALASPRVEVREVDGEPPRSTWPAGRGDLRAATVRRSPTICEPRPRPPSSSRQLRPRRRLADACARNALPSARARGSSPGWASSPALRVPRRPSPSSPTRRLPRGGPPPRSRPRRGLRSFLSDFRDLKVGDLVVPRSTGSAGFLGSRRWRSEGRRAS